MSMQNAFGQAGVKEALLTTSFDGRILFFSRGAEALLGYREAHVLGVGIQELLPENHRRLDRLNLEEVSAGNVVRNVQVKLHHQDGTVRRCLQTMLPLRDRSRQAISVVRCLLDLTFLWQAELQLRQCVAVMADVEELGRTEVRGPEALGGYLAERDRLLRGYREVVRHEAGRLGELLVALESGPGRHSQRRERRAQRVH